MANQESRAAEWSEKIDVQKLCLNQDQKLRLWQLQYQGECLHEQLC